MTATIDPKRAQNSWARFGWLMPLLWLVFMGYPISEVVASRAPQPWIVLAWGALVLFAGAYSWGSIDSTKTSNWSPGTTIQWVFFAVMLSCVAATAPAIGSGWMNFLPFLMGYASYVLRGWWHWVVMIVAVVTLLGVVAATDTWDLRRGLMISVAMVAVANTLVTMLIARSFTERRRQLDLALSDQRSEFGRDVHDLLGHSLTVIKLKAELALRLVERDPTRARAEIEQIIALSAEAIDTVRATVSELRGLDLGAQLEASNEALLTAGVSVAVMGEADALSPAQATTATWVLREATTNILRHARASAVRVGIAPGTLTITDDGVGVTNSPGNGVRGMAERVHASGGMLSIERGPNGGTEVRVRW